MRARERERERAASERARERERERANPLLPHTYARARARVRAHTHTQASRRRIILPPVRARTRTRAGCTHRYHANVVFPRDAHQDHAWDQRVSQALANRICLLCVVGIHKLLEEMAHALPLSQSPDVYPPPTLTFLRLQAAFVQRPPPNATTAHRAPALARGFQSPKH